MYRKACTCPVNIGVGIRQPTDRNAKRVASREHLSGYLEELLAPTAKVPRYAAGFRDDGAMGGAVRGALKREPNPSMGIATITRACSGIGERGGGGDDLGNHDRHTGKQHGNNGYSNHPREEDLLPLL